MAANSNDVSHQENMNASFHHPRMVSFQSGATNSSTGTIPVGMSSLDGNSSMASMFMSAASGMINHMDAMTPARYLAGSVLGEALPRFTHVSGSPAYWFPEEVEMLNRGLIKYANELSIQKYTKIAATLPQKTIRDVALRSQWMINKENDKGRKMEEYYATKKMKDAKEKMLRSPSTTIFCRNPDSLMMHRMSIHDQLSSEEMKLLLDENERFLGEIARNLEGDMIQDNITLFHYMRNNIKTIENRINVMSTTINQFPGSMRQIPLLPVSVDDELLGGLIPLNGNAIYNSPGSSRSQLSFRPDIG